MYTVISLIILIIEIIMVLAFSIHAVKNKVIISKKTIWFYFPLCLMLFILYLCGLVNYTKINNLKITIFDLFEVGKSILSASVFDVKKVFVVDLVNNNVIFAVTFFSTILLLVISLYTTILSTIIMRFVNRVRVNLVLKKNCDILIGENNYNKIYYQQYKKCIVLLDHKKRDNLIEYYFDKVPVIFLEFNQKNLLKVLKKSLRKKHEVNFISFNSSSKNLKYIDEFKQFLSKKYHEQQIVDYRQFYLKVEIDLDNQLSIQNKILEDKRFSAFISCFNRYEYNALNFIEKYPITKKLPSTFFDYETATIKKDTLINNIYLGFGRVSKAIHRAQIMNNQLPTIENGKIKEYHVNYYAFENLYTFREDKNTIFFNERYDEHISEFSNEKYFPSIEKVDQIKYYNYDVFSNQFFDEFKKIIFKEHCFNRIIVSVGDDVDNIDYALKLQEFFKEEKIDSYEMFVRVKDDYLIAEELLKDSKVILFGHIEEIFNHQVIVNEKLIKLSKELNQKYNALRLADTLWYELSSIKQFSNIYSSLNLRLKLNLLGYDYKEEKSIQDNSLLLNDLIKTLEFNPISYEDYLFFNKKEIQPANSISYQEHSRWNAFYVSYGYVPMEKAEIKLIDEKSFSFYKDSFEYRKHACLTTYEGLDLYHRYLASLIKNGSFENNLNEVQTYKYDYMMLDNIINLFKDSHYQLIKVKK